MHFPRLRPGSGLGDAYRKRGATPPPPVEMRVEMMNNPMAGGGGGGGGGSKGGFFSGSPFKKGGGAGAATGRRPSLGAATWVETGAGYELNPATGERRYPAGDDATGKGQLLARQPTDEVAAPARARPQWEEVSDPESGRPYWFHTQTGATTWEQPY